LKWTTTKKMAVWLLLSLLRYRLWKPHLMKMTM
jgi:hypothetical protein